MDNDTIKTESAIDQTIEELPTMETYYLIVVKYSKEGSWHAGSMSKDKAEIIEQLKYSWTNCHDRKIVTLKLPF